jgi:protein-disulfide isomerase
MKIPVSLVTLLAGGLALAQMPPKTSKTMGTPVAAITIDLYSDFQCPHCKLLHETWMGPLIRDYVLTGKVHLIQHEFPLPQHPYAKTAAYYACAADRIGKYGEVADALFKNQDAWGRDGKVDETVSSVLMPAEAAKVRALAKDPAIAAQVEKDLDLGRQIPLKETPTVIVTYKGKHYPADVRSSYAIFAIFLNSLTH